MMLALPLLAVTGWFAYSQYQQARFINQLDLVAFSTSMVGGPNPGAVRAANERAEELGIDLPAAYKNHLNEPPRFSIACLLIDRESHPYFDYCRENVADIPWPEVRIWRMRVNDKALTAATRGEILELLLSSPTSEAKLFAGRWYREQSRLEESEDAYFDAMSNGLFRDALDAADQLLDCPRYRADAIRHHVIVLKEGEHFTWRSAASLVRVYKLEGELKPLLEAAKTERGFGPKRKELVDILNRHAEADLGGPINRLQFFVCGVSAGSFQLWLMPHLLALILPPAILLLRRNRWRVSLHTLFTGVTVAAVASWLLGSGWRLVADSSSPIRLLVDMAGNIVWTVVPVLLLSLVATWIVGCHLRPWPTIKFPETGSR